MNWKRHVPERLKDLVGRPLGLRGVGTREQWQRTVMNLEIDKWIDAAEPARLKAVEISGSERAHHAWLQFDSLQFPEFDLCAPSAAIPQQYDVVVCEQVLEHVPNPWLALERLHALSRPGGHLIVSTPFLIRVHAGPGDYWRFTKDGLVILLERAGFEIVSAGAWGNRACVRANLRRWAKQRRWSTLRNDPRYPVAVWAIAQRPVEPASRSSNSA